MLERRLFEPFAKDPTTFALAEAGREVSDLVSRTKALGDEDRDRVQRAIERFNRETADISTIPPRLELLTAARKGPVADVPALSEDASRLSENLKRLLSAFQDLRQVLGGEALGSPGTFSGSFESVMTAFLRETLRFHSLLIDDHLHAGLAQPWSEFCKVLHKGSQADVAAQLQAIEPHVRLINVRAAIISDLREMLRCGAVTDSTDTGITRRKLLTLTNRDCRLYGGLCIGNASLLTLSGGLGADAHEALHWLLERITNLVAGIDDELDDQRSPGSLTLSILSCLGSRCAEYLTDLQRAVADLDATPHEADAPPHRRALREAAASLASSMSISKELLLEISPTCHVGSTSALPPDLADEAARLYVDSFSIEEQERGAKPLSQEEAIECARTARVTRAEQARQSLLASELAEQSGRSGNIDHIGKSVSRSKRSKAKAKAQAPAPQTLPVASTSSAGPACSAPQLSAAEAAERASAGISVATASMNAARREVQSADPPRSLKYIEFKVLGAQNCLDSVSRELDKQGHVAEVRKLRDLAAELAAESELLKAAQARKLWIHAPSREHLDRVKSDVSVRFGRREVPLRDVSESGWFRRPREYFDEVILTLRGEAPRVPGPDGKAVAESKVVFHVHRTPGSDQYVAAHFKRMWERKDGESARRSSVSDARYIRDLLAQAARNPTEPHEDRRTLR